MRKLATGGMAEVFLAKAEGPGGFEKNLVLKRILPHLAEREMFVDMFLAEARIAAQLDHPNIVQIFDFGEADGSYFLAMEWVDGPNLRGLNRWSLTNSEYLPLPLVARIVAQAAEGLAYAHEFTDPESGRLLNLIHRDVSGENILVGKTGAVKVLDFGIAKVSGEGGKTRVGALKGKISYMSPEQVRGQPLDRRADVYALGVVLYQLLTGRKAYDQKGDVALIAAILADPPVPVLTRRSDLPPELSAIVHRAMARDRDARYPSCREFQEALERFIASSGETVGTQHLAQLVARYQASGFATTNPPSGTGSPSKTGGSRPGTSPGIVPAAPAHAPAAPVRSRRAQAEATLAEEDEEAAEETPLPQAPVAARGGRRPSTLEPAAAKPKDGESLELVSTFEFVQWQAAGTNSEQAIDLITGQPIPSSAGAIELSSSDEAPLVLAAASDYASFQAPAPAASAPAPAAPRAVTGSRPAAPAPAARPRPEAQPAAPGPEVVGTPLGYTPCSVAPEPIQQAVRQSADADRSLHLLRRFPSVAARILENCRDVPRPLAETFAAVLDAAFLSENHSAVRRLLEKADENPGAGGRFGAMVRGELTSPLRFAWLAERLRSVVPGDAASLRGWLTKLGPEHAPLLLWLIDTLEPGPGQDLACEALAPHAAADPSLVVSLLDVTPAPKNAGALWYVLERANWKERGKLQIKLMQRRDPALQVAIMGARAKVAGGEDASTLLAQAISERSEDVRRCALKLLGEMDDERVVTLLTSQMQGPAFDGKPVEERTAYWAALGASSRPSALAHLEQVLMQKTNLLNRKKSLELKLPALEGLVEMRGDAAVRLLERIVADRSQPDEVAAAAKQAMDKRRFRKGAGPDVRADPRAALERRVRLLRSLCLDFVLLARATSAVDLSTGMLDAALERFRESVRQALLADGKFKLVVGPKGLDFNGTPVALGGPPGAADPNLLAAQVLHGRDFRGFALEVPLPTTELRGMLLRLFDPDGESERLPHLRVATFSGRSLAPVSDPPAPDDPTGRARELYGWAVNLLRQQRATLQAGRPVLLAQARAILDEWAALYPVGSAALRGLIPAAPADAGFAFHAANTALTAMAFAADLGLSRAHLRETAELSLFHSLGQFNVPAAALPPAGEGAPDDARLRLAWLLLAQNRSRRGATYAVAAWEAGLPANADEARSPGIAASIFALAEAWDALTVGARLSPAQALEQMQGPLRRRFHAQLLPLFARWAGVQAGLAQA